MATQPGLDHLGVEFTDRDGTPIGVSLTDTLSAIIN